MSKDERPRRMLDLFCGRGGWTNAFLDRGWEVVGVDLVRNPDYRGEFVQANVLQIKASQGRFIIREHEDRGPDLWEYEPDFVCASSPCEKFSIWGMAHFHPEPEYPFEGIELFNYTRALLERAGVRYIMENVRPAQKFVGEAQAHCGPFYLWGNAVAPLLPQGITKGIDIGSSKLVKQMSIAERREYRAQFKWNQGWSSSPQRSRDTALAATIPPELASCVADYAERLLEIKATL